MKRYLKWMISIILCLIFIRDGVTFWRGMRTPDILTANVELEYEMKGVWIATVLNLDYPTVPTDSAEELRRQADLILNNVEEWGFNAVFLQVRPCSDAFYDSEIFPWSVYLTGKQGRAPEDGFDPLQYWVQEAHERNLEVHAWINPFRIAQKEAAWNALTADSPAKQHPEWGVKYKDDYYFDPAIPEVRKLLVDGTMELVMNYEVDGIHMDDYFYPGIDFYDDVSYAVYGGGFTDIGDWRRNNVNLLIHDMSIAIHTFNPHLKFGISPHAVWAEKLQYEDGSDTTGSFSSYDDLYADTKYWVEAGWLDYIAPQIYYTIGDERNDFMILLNWWTDVVEESETDTKLYIGLADYKASEEGYFSPWYNGKEIARQMNACRSSSKIDGMLHFRYKFIVDNPALRHIICQAYQTE